MMSRILWHYVQSMKSFYLSRQDLEYLQSKKLSHLLRYSYDNVPYYHESLRAMGKVPSDFEGIRGLRDIPLLKKGDAARHGKQLIANNAAPKYFRRGSGTSGQVVTLAYDQVFQDLTLAIQARHLTHFGIRPWKRLVSIWAPKKYWRRETRGPRRGQPYTWADELGAVAKLGKLSTRYIPLQATMNDPGRDLKELVKLDPDFIMCPPSHLVRMSDHLPQSGGGIEVEGMNFINEAFTEATARRIERAFGGKAFNSLGSNELGVAGADCAHKTGLHLNEDWILFEVLKDGEQVGAGEKGELVATVFSNAAMPLIRYATGDTVELADGGVCPCGSVMTRIKRVLGRKEDWLRGARGELIPPLDVAEEIEASLGMMDYQLIQKSVKDFEVKTADPDRDEKTFSVSLEAYLTAKAGAAVNLKFSKRPQEDAWLKSRPVVCAIPS